MRTREAFVVPNLVGELAQRIAEPMRQRYSWPRPPVAEAAAGRDQEVIVAAVEGKQRNLLRALILATIPEESGSQA
ncbi:MAG: hypothetical protein DWQ37_22030 [Planctomycetota bacterium]|nr:MAG: hypothetical protein DWQ37_22030 [Planctomycetota bacterium]